MSRILLVDDEAELAAELAEALELRGFDVVTASSGAEALTRLTADPEIAVVVTDKRMPRMDGLQLAATLRAPPWSARRLGIILLTGFVLEEDRERAATLRINAMVTKPVMSQNLVAAIQTVMADPENGPAPSL